MLGNETLIRVAIDGPGGAGKSTIAKQVAKELGIDYIDTGAMYRAIGLKLSKNAVDIDDEEKLSKVIKNTEIDFNKGSIYLDGIDVSDKIRTSEISMMASDCSKKKLVREKLVSIQREMGMRKSVVMDGRDIGTNVLKDAEIKIFLTADAEIRAKRRYDELLEKGESPNYDRVLKEIVERDYQDSNRELNPLEKATDAILLDTSNMSIKEVADCIKGYIEKI